jgi:small subunit ribosomal protein S9
MADEPEQQDEQPEAADEQPEAADEQSEAADEQPQQEAEEQPQPEAEAAEQPEEAAEAQTAGSDEAEEPDEAERAEDAAVEAPEETEGAEEPAGEPVAEATKEPAAKDLPPGAELDPIALEPDRPLSAEEKARLEAEAEEKARLEAEATAEAPEEQPAGGPRSVADLAADARYMATGKRKRSIARVTITPGDGKFVINRRELKEYFPRPLHQSTALQPLTVAGYEGTVDVRVNVKGGGIGGQAGAIRHGISRALTEIDPELRRELKRRGFLTRDARVKERRKAGLKKARKRPQFSKR